MIDSNRTQVLYMKCVTEVRHVRLCVFNMLQCNMALILMTENVFYARRTDVYCT